LGAGRHSQTADGDNCSHGELFVVDSCHGSISCLGNSSLHYLPGLPDLRTILFNEDTAGIRPEPCFKGNLSLMLTLPERQI